MACLSWQVGQTGRIDIVASGGGLETCLRSQIDLTEITARLGPLP